MAETEQEGASEAQAEEATEQLGLLDQAIQATKQTEPSRAEELVAALAEEALKGTVTWNKNITVSITNAIAD